MAADDVRFGPFDFDVLLTRQFPRLDPFQSLARRHVEVGLEERFVLSRRDAFRAEITGTVAVQRFPDRAVQALGRGQAVFLFIYVTAGVDLLGPDALGDSPCRRDGILTAQSDEAHFKGRHLSPGPDAHGIAGTGVEGTVPHLVPGKTGIVGPVEAGCAACGTEDGFGPDFIGRARAHIEAQGAGHGIVADDVVGNIQMVDDLDAIELLDGVGQDGLDIFAVDLDVARAAGDVFTLFVLQNDQSQVFQLPGDFVEAFGHGEEQVFPDDAGCVFLGVVDVELRRMALGDIGIQGIDAGCQTAAAADIGLFGDDHGRIRQAAEGQGGITAGRPAADDEDIRMDDLLAGNLHNIDSFVKYRKRQPRSWRCFLLNTSCRRRGRTSGK